MSLQLMGVGTRHCRVLSVSNINSDATGVEMSGFHGLLYHFPERGLKQGEDVLYGGDGSPLPLPREGIETPNWLFQWALDIVSGCMGMI